jgi:hypothetical protein
MMLRRTANAALLAVAAMAVTAAAAFGVASVRIYSNDMSTVSDRAELRALAGGNCDRGGSPEALRVAVGRRTKQCIYNTPVVGRDLDISATARLLSGTPDSIRPRIFLGLDLRTGGGGRYELAVFPIKQEWKLRKYTPEEETFTTLAKGEAERIKGVNKANQMRLRAFNLTSTREKDDCRLLVYINGKRFAVEVDHEAGPLKGRYSGVSVGSRKVANGAIASFDDVSLRVPDPY